MTLPFEDTNRRKYGTEQIYKIRRFRDDVNPEDLIWHRDKETRLVTVIKSVGWMFQFDEMLPFELEVGEKFEITRGVYHRIIKGTGEWSVRFLVGDKK